MLTWYPLFWASAGITGNVFSCSGNWTMNPGKRNSKLNHQHPEGFHRLMEFTFTLLWDLDQPGASILSSWPILSSWFELSTNRKPRFHPLLTSPIPSGCFTGFWNEAHKSTLLGGLELSSLLAVSGNSGMSSFPLNNNKFFFRGNNLASLNSTF